MQNTNVHAPLRMEGDKTSFEASFKKEEQATHSTAESEKLPREYGETGQTACESMYTALTMWIQKLNI